MLITPCAPLAACHHAMLPSLPPFCFDALHALRRHAAAVADATFSPLLIELPPRHATPLLRYATTPRRHISIYADSDVYALTF